MKLKLAHQMLTEAHDLIEEMRTTINIGPQHTCKTCGNSRFVHQFSYEFNQLLINTHKRIRTQLISKVESHIRSGLETFADVDEHEAKARKKLQETWEQRHAKK